MPSFFKRTLAALACVLGAVCLSAEQGLPPSLHLLPADRAYTLEEHWLDEDQQLHLHWRITPGYHLYRDQFAFKTERHVRLGTPEFEPTLTHTDTLMDHAAWYASDTTVVLPIERAPAGPLQIKVTFQGCSEHGFCYPPTTQTIHLNLPEAIQSEEAWFAWQPWRLVAFYFYGLLLGFTPCILPMVPILLGVLLSEHHAQRKRRDHLLLGGMYVFSMAATYAVAGLVTAMLGTSLQGMLQTPAVLLGSGALLLVLGVLQWFEVTWSQASSYNTLLNNLSRHLPGHGLMMASGMGVLSALVVSPCVTPPLIGALTLIAQEGAWLEGAARLWLLGLGLGTPLLLVALLGRDVLPQAGPWLQHTHTLAGALLIGLGISLITPLYQGPLTLAFWVALLLLTAYRLAKPEPSKRPPGLTLLVGLLLAYSLALAYQGTQARYTLTGPWHALTQQPLNERVVFRETNTLEALNKQLSFAQRHKRPVLLEFTADWCAACQDNKQHVWTAPEVAEALQGWLLLRADISHQSPLEQALMLQHQVVAPPTLLFFDAKGDEDTAQRLHGSLTPEALLLHLQQWPAFSERNALKHLDTGE